MDRSQTIAGRKGAGERDVTDEYGDPGGESELRRRAAWLLLMLVVVAALLVTLMLLFLNSGGGKPAPNGIKPLPTAPPSTAHRQHSAAPKSAAHTSPHAKKSVTVPPRVVHPRVNCPSEAPCIAHGDIGNAVAAINAYRVRHGEPAVNGAVTPAAQTCAVTNGDQCSGSWAESQVSRATGAAAVQKVGALTNLLDPNLASLEVGWAYDPAAHQYYFAVIRDDS